MEKIAIALQRALKAAGSGDEPLFASTPNADEVSVSDKEQRRGRIAYTHTRCFDIPAHVLERHRVISVQDDTRADAFRMLRTQLLMRMRQNRWRTLAVTSPNKGAGKSTVSLNLAIGFATELDHTALLVDADLRDPDLRKMLELEPGPGLADYLAGTVALEDVLIHPNIGNLVVLPGGTPIAKSSELMRSPMMEDMVRELSSRYEDRLIVFDVPSVLAGADTLALSAYIDATILIVEECKTARDDIERACELLRDSNLIGIVLNKSRELPEPEPVTWPKPNLFRRLFSGAG
jgi:capsular exopolysaccharide synthesis family protein